MDVPAHNRKAWDRLVTSGSRWTVPVTSEEIAAARAGTWHAILTPVKPVPRAWFGDIAGKTMLGLASAGGQQAPIFAAAGAQVTVLDNSPGQLGQDRLVAEREGLDLRLELGEMADLSRFADSSFDLIFHPVSNVFAPEIRPVWRECARVLKPGGALLAGFANPANYLFDVDGDPEPFPIRYRLPYADASSLDAATLAVRIDAGEALEFSHSLDDQIGGQIEAGLVIAGFYEDRWPDHPLDPYFPTFMATRAVKT